MRFRPGQEPESPRASGQNLKQKQYYVFRENFFPVVYFFLISSIWRRKWQHTQKLLYLKAMDRGRGSLVTQVLQK